MVVARIEGAREELTPNILHPNERQNKAIDALIVESDELTYDDERSRSFLETKVDRGLYEAWAALRELRVRKLYRPKTWEEYCKRRFGYGRDPADLKVFAADVVDELEKMPTNGRQILPTSDRQVRNMRGLTPDEYRQVWLESVESSGGKVPSGRVVKSIVERIKERTPTPNPYRQGEICQIVAKGNRELRLLSGCWGIVLNAGALSCCIRTWNGDYPAVKPENLESFDYTDTECREAQQICSRITRLRTHDLESAAMGVLEGLGRLKRSRLTSLEEKILGLLEEEYLS